MKCTSAAAAANTLGRAWLSSLIQDGKPYILYMCAGLVTDPERAKGFTVVGKTEFASMDDMKFYDFECPAHQNLKALAGSLGLSEPPHTVFFEGTPLLNVPN